MITNGVHKAKKGSLKKKSSQSDNTNRLEQMSVTFKLEIESTKGEFDGKPTKTIKTNNMKQSIKRSESLDHQGIMRQIKKEGNCRAAK